MILIAATQGVKVRANCLTSAGADAPFCRRTSPYETDCSVRGLCAHGCRSLFASKDSCSAAAPKRVYNLVTSRWRLVYRVILFAVAAAALLAGAADKPALSAQSPASQWEKAAGTKMSFDVASVKKNASGSNSANTNFAWSMTTEVPQTGGLFVATNWPLYQYIFFAYKPDLVQQTALLDALPKWVRAEHFDIQGRASGNPTGDQYRLMMQSLLAERFKLAVHSETHDAPVFALVLAKPGKLGPQLRLHVDDPPCADPSIAIAQSGLSATEPDGFPQPCGRVVPVRPRTPGCIAAFGGRDVTMNQFINRIGYGALSELGRPLADKTNITGKLDVFIEWTPPVPPNVSTPEMQDAPGLAQALSQQLGLKLESTKFPLETMIVDHIEQPTPN